MHNTKTLLHQRLLHATNSVNRGRFPEVFGTSEWFLQVCV